MYIPNNLGTCNNTFSGWESLNDIYLKQVAVDDWEYDDDGHDHDHDDQNHPMLRIRIKNNCNTFNKIEDFKRLITDH